MKRIAYTVTATLPDEATSREYVAWLKGGHIARVIAGGAESGTIVRMDVEEADDPPRVEARYIFATRDAFDRYVREHAPRLRAEGLERFGPERKITFARSIGEIA